MRKDPCFWPETEMFCVVIVDIPYLRLETRKCTFAYIFWHIVFLENSQREDICSDPRDGRRYIEFFYTNVVPLGYLGYENGFQSIDVATTMTPPVLQSASP